MGISEVNSIKQIKLNQNNVSNPNKKLINPFKNNHWNINLLPDNSVDKFSKNNAK